MKKQRLLMVLSLSVLVVFLSAGSSGAVNKGNTGCGLGYYFFKNASDSFLVQLLAVTTNSLGTQTFGILTETFGCRQPKRLAHDERLNEFVAGNMDSLAAEMASGEGESLATLAELMEVPEPQRDGFYVSLKENFTRIFTSSDIRSSQLIENILEVTG
jgi:hypothetical protein